MGNKSGFGRTHMIVRGITTLNFAFLLIDTSPFGPGFYDTLERVHLGAVPVYYWGASTFALVIIVVMEIIEALHQRTRVEPRAVPRLVKLAVSVDAILVVAWLVVFSLSIARSVPW